VKGYQALPLLTVRHRRVGGEPGNEANYPLRTCSLQILDVCMAAHCLPNDSNFWRLGTVELSVNCVLMTVTKI